MASSRSAADRGGSGSLPGPCPHTALAAQSQQRGDHGLPQLRDCGCLLSTELMCAGRGTGGDSSSRHRKPSPDHVRLEEGAYPGHIKPGLHKKTVDRNKSSTVNTPQVRRNRALSSERGALRLRPLIICASRAECSALSRRALRASHMPRAAHAVFQVFGGLWVPRLRSFASGSNWCHTCWCGRGHYA